MYLLTEELVDKLLTFALNPGKYSTLGIYGVGTRYKIFHRWNTPNNFFSEISVPAASRKKREGRNFRSPRTPWLPCTYLHNSRNHGQRYSSIFINHLLLAVQLLLNCYAHICFMVRAVSHMKTNRSFTVGPT